MDLDSIVKFNTLAAAIRRDYNLRATIRHRISRGEYFSKNAYITEQKNIGRLVAPYIGTLYLALAVAYVKAVYHRPLTRREAMLLPLAFSLACGGSPAAPDNPNPPPNPIPVPLDAVEFENSIVDLINSKNQPGTGEIYIPGAGSQQSGLTVGIQNGKYGVTKDKGLVPGAYPGMKISAPGFGIERELTGIVTPAGIEVNLMDGRIETPLNVIRQNGFDQSLYEQLFLRFLNHSQRHTSRLDFGVLDSNLYRVSNAGNTMEIVGPYTMRKTSKTTLWDVLRKDVEFWSDGFYSAADLRDENSLPSYVKVQSRGDNIPDKSARTEKWFLIFPLENIPEGYAIAQSDSTTDNISYAFMGFHSTTNMPRVSWTRDLRESLGLAEVRELGVDNNGNPLPEMRKYARALYGRPPRHALPDRIV